MEPVLKPGDLLQVFPYVGRKVRYGDVILYCCPSKNCNVVHRVADVDARGIRTKGDNNIRLDPWIVIPQQVIGYVVRVLRGSRWRRIPGGYVGYLVANGARVMKHVAGLAYGTRAAIHI
jgi:signal peptidase I